MRIGKIVLDHLNSDLNYILTKYLLVLYVFVGHNLFIETDSNIQELDNNNISYNDLSR